VAGGRAGSGTVKHCQCWSEITGAQDADTQFTCAVMRCEQISVW
jgi:hypothetical protein